MGTPVSRLVFLRLSGVGLKVPPEDVEKTQIRPLPGRCKHHFSSVLEFQLRKLNAQIVAAFEIGALTIRMKEENAGKLVSPSA